MIHWTKFLQRRKRLAPLETPRVTSGPPTGPQDALVCAVGDIHGQIACLERLLEKVRIKTAATKERPLQFVFLGDYIDRGPHSRRVIETLISLGDTQPCTFVRGNHEQALLDFLEDPRGGESWVQFGGRETLAAYGVGLGGANQRDIDWHRVREQFCQALPRTHRSFLEQTQFYHTAGDFFFAHAGIDPAFALDDQPPKALMTIRDRFLKNKDVRDKIVVHGHSMSQTPTFKRNRIGLDTGAYATNILSALLIDGDHLEVITS